MQTDGKAAVKIVPPRPRIPCWKGLGADSEEKQELASDIDIAVVDSLKVLDPNRPIREADIGKAVLNKRVSKSRALQLPYPPADSPPRSGLMQYLFCDPDILRHDSESFVTHDFRNGSFFGHRHTCPRMSASPPNNRHPPGSSHKRRSPGQTTRR